MDDASFSFGQSLRPQMAADIQRVRWALAKVEEKFNENPNYAVGNAVMRQLLDCYKDCKAIDQLLKTSHFEEEHFDGLVEKVKVRSGRLGNAQLAMAEHVNKMFSDQTAPKKCEDDTDHDKGESEVGPATANEAAVAWQLAEGERAEKDDRETCLKMLSLMKDQLLKCHDSLTRRLGATGGQNAIFSPEDLAESNEEASYDLEGIMSSILGATRQHIQRQLVALFSPFVDQQPAQGENGAVTPPPPNDDGSGVADGQYNMDLAASSGGDGGAKAAPSGVTSEDIAKALYGGTTMGGTGGGAAAGDGTEKEKPEEPTGAAGPSSVVDENNGEKENSSEKEGKSICTVLAFSPGPTFCLPTLASSIRLRRCPNFDYLRAVRWAGRSFGRKCHSSPKVLHKILP